jgi:hypothetical protein
MNKILKNIFPVLIAICIIVAIPIVLASGKNDKKTPSNAPETSADTAVSPTVPTTIPTPSPKPSPSPSPTPSAPLNTAPPTMEEFFSDTLFIGDSRTVGLSEYGNMPTATFFATTGMSVYSLFDTTVTVPSIGDVYLENLLQGNTYGKIYLMLGINELGYDFESTVEKYTEVVNRICQLQPNAVLYICANLHVSHERSRSDDIFNNTNIDRFNQRISELANQKTIFYIDVNPIFDDENGALGTEYTADDTHVLGKYYVTWGEWLYENTVQQ